MTKKTQRLLKQADKVLWQARQSRLETSAFLTETKLHGFWLWCMNFLMFAGYVPLNPELQ